MLKNPIPIYNILCIKQKGYLIISCCEHKIILHTKRYIVICPVEVKSLTFGSTIPYSIHNSSISPSCYISDYITTTLVHKPTGDKPFSERMPPIYRGTKRRFFCTIVSSLRSYNTRHITSLCSNGIPYWYHSHCTISSCSRECADSVLNSKCQFRWQLA